MEEKLYELFQKTLAENENVSIQRIVQGQVKAIQQKQQPKIEKMASITNIQKKLEAIEKNLMIQDSARKRRTSRYHSKKHSTKIATQIGSSPSPYQLDLEDAGEYEIESLRRENQRLNERLEQLLQQNEDRGQIEMVSEQESLRELKQECKERENQLRQKSYELDQQEIALNKKHSSLLQENKKTEILSQNYRKNEERLKEKREAIDALQQQINLNIAQVISINKAELKVKLIQKLGVQLEAVEQLMNSTLKERQVIQQEHLCLRQLQNVITESKRDYQKKL